MLSHLADLLKQSNGFAMWGGAFLLLPSGAVDNLPSVESYNAHDWKRSYSPAVQSTVFFALDVFGFSFGISEDRVVRLDPETGVLYQIADTLGHLLERVRNEPIEMVGIEMFNAWCESGRSMEIGQRLAPKVPFVLGGGEAVSEFYPADILERAAFNAYIYEQIRDLPDGATIELLPAS